MNAVSSPEHKLIPQENINKALKAIDRYCSEDSSLKDIVEGLGIPFRDFYRIKGTSIEVEQAMIQAREIKSHALVDEMIEISDTEVDPQLAKVKIDTRKWIASKFNHVDYGEKIDVNQNIKLDLAGILTAARERANIIDMTPNALPDKSE